MPSVRYRLCKPFVRFNLFLSLGSYGPVKYHRFMLDLVASLSPKTPGVGHEPLDISGIPAEWSIPHDSKSDQVLLYFHGGGYTEGSIRSHRAMVSRLAAAARCRALLIEYRLAPENKFPCALEDALISYRWLLSLGYEPARIVIGGDSAGGGLTVATLISLRDSGDPLPAAGILLSPWTDLAITGESVKTVGRGDPMLTRRMLEKMAGMYLGPTDPRHPLASPIYGDLKGLPPLCIHVGTHELLLDDATRLATRAREDGVAVELDIWDGMFHVWQALPSMVPESRAAVEHLGKFYQGAVGIPSVQI